jgi:HK97 family phage portal protein
MGVISWLKKAFSAPIKYLTGYATVGSARPVYDRYNQELNINRYVTQDDIYSVIRMIAKTAAQVPVRVYKIKNQTKFKKYQYAVKTNDSSPSCVLRLMKLKQAALEEVPQDDELQILLDSPNEDYTRAEFMEGFFTFRLSCGNSYVYTPKLEEGVNKGKTTGMWLMPVQYTNPVITQTFPKEITNYQIRLLGIVDIVKTDVMHSRYFNPQFTVMGDELIGLSPLQALSRNAQKGQSENDFMVSSFQNHGSNGVLSFEGMEEGEAATLGQKKKEYYAESSGTINAMKTFWTTHKVTYTPLGQSVVDMQVLESQMMTLKKFCNAYGVSARLFNNDGTGSIVSDTNARKGLYLNAVVPEVSAWCDIVNKDLAPAYGPDYYVDYDVSEISELQTDMKLLADSLAVSWWLTPNEKRTVQSFETSSDPLMDKVYIPSGIQAIDDLQPVDPLQNPAGDYGAGA